MATVELLLAPWWGRNSTHLTITEVIYVASVYSRRNRQNEFVFPPCSQIGLGFGQSDSQFIKSCSNRVNTWLSSFRKPSTFSLRAHCSDNVAAYFSESLLVLSCYPIHALLSAQTNWLNLSKVSLLIGLIQFFSYKHYSSRVNVVAWDQLNRR